MRTTIIKIDFTSLFMILALRDPQLLEGPQRALRLTRSPHPYDDRPARPGIERTVNGLREIQLRFITLRSHGSAATTLLNSFPSS